jgi:hypothetical protein
MASQGSGHPIEVRVHKNATSVEENSLNHGLILAKPAP